jgi:cytoskeletal protein RodZ
MTESTGTQPKADTEPEQAQPASQPTPATAHIKAKKPKSRRFQRFLRASLIWLVAIAVVFMTGVLTYHFTRYRPLNKTLTQAQSDLVEANQNISDLETRLAAANDKVAALESDNQALQSEMDTAKAHLELLRVLVDINNARLALFQNNVEAAKAALTNTSQRLEDLRPSIAEYDASLAKSMPQRLSLIISGLERDVETAKIDLELITKDLLEIEGAIFGN